MSVSQVKKTFKKSSKKYQNVTISEKIRKTTKIYDFGKSKEKNKKKGFNILARSNLFITDMCQMSRLSFFVGINSEARFFFTMFIPRVRRSARNKSARRFASLRRPKLPMFFWRCVPSQMHANACSNTLHFKGWLFVGLKRRVKRVIFAILTEMEHPVLKVLWSGFGGFLSKATRFCRFIARHARHPSKKTQAVHSRLL